MGEEITLYELFQLKVLRDEDLLSIGKTLDLVRIILIRDQLKVQIFYGQDGWLMRTYHFK